MRPAKRIRFLLFLGLLCWASSAFSATETGFVQGVLEDLSRTSPKTPQARSELFKKIETYYDFRAMFRKCAHDIWDQLTVDQQVTLKEKFVSMMTRKMVQKSDRLFGRRLEGAEYSLKERVGEESVVEVVGRAKGKKVRLDLTLSPQDASYRITDLAVEGALLSRNYRGQFNRIFRVEGYAGLESRVEKNMPRDKSYR